MSEKRPKFPIPQMNEFRAELERVAERDTAAMKPTVRRRRVRRGLLIGFAVVGVGGAVAGAAELISTGEPVEIPKVFSDRYRPGDDKPVLALSAPDLEAGRSWGVVIYDKAGELCAYAGQRRGDRIGVVEDGRFRVYPPDTPGACGKPRPDINVLSTAYVAGADERTLVFGRASRRVQRVRATFRRGGEVSFARTGTGGAFLFVFKGRVRPGDFKVVSLDADGRLVSPT